MNDFYKKEHTGRQIDNKNPIKPNSFIKEEKQCEYKKEKIVNSHFSSIIKAKDYLYIDYLGEEEIEKWIPNSRGIGKIISIFEI